MAPKRVKQKLPGRKKIEGEEFGSGDGGQVRDEDGGDGGGGATMLANMEPWRKASRQLTKKLDRGSPVVWPGRPAPSILSTFINNVCQI